MSIWIASPRKFLGLIRVSVRDDLWDDLWDGPWDDPWDDRQPFETIMSTKAQSEFWNQFPLLLEWSMPERSVRHFRITCDLLQIATCNPTVSLCLAVGIRHVNEMLVTCQVAFISSLELLQIASRQVLLVMIADPKFEFKTSVLNQIFSTSPTSTWTSGPEASFVMPQFSWSSLWPPS